MSDKPRLARCPRCGLHGLVADGQGLRVAVDILPVDALGFGNAVASGVGLWALAKAQDGTPGRLRPYRRGQEVTWSPQGPQIGVQRLHAEHGCGAPARDMVIINVQSPKGSAPATPGAPGAGIPPHDALDAGARALASPSPATSATPRLSEVLGNCGICGRRIKAGEKYWSIVHGHIWADGAHEDCP